MISTKRSKRLHLLLLLAMTLGSRSAFAQVSLTGDWQQTDRTLPVIADYYVGDFTALPIKSAALQGGDSWDESRWSQPERQCTPYGASQVFRNAASVRFSEERDPLTQELVAIKIFVSTFAQPRTIWMDGRPHPSKYAPHTWQGFSTGKWNGNILTVTTTHLKQFWHRRNGIFTTAWMVVTEQFLRHGGHMTIVSMIDDPAILTEPLVYSANLVNSADVQAGAWQTHGNCQIDIEIVGRATGYVPHVFPDPKSGVEFATKFGLPLEATRGGAETIYPEYITKLRKLFEAANQRVASR